MFWVDELTEKTRLGLIHHHFGPYKGKLAENLNRGHPGESVFLPKREVSHMLCHESHLPTVQAVLDFLRRVGKQSTLGTLWEEGWWSPKPAGRGYTVLALPLTKMQICAFLGIMVANPFNRNVTHGEVDFDCKLSIISLFPTCNLIIWLTEIQIKWYTKYLSDGDQRKMINSFPSWTMNSVCSNMI